MSIGAWADWIAVTVGVLFYVALFASGMVAASRSVTGETAKNRR